MPLRVGTRRSLIFNPAPVVSGSFSPSDVSGLYFWLKSDAGVFQDAGSTPSGNGDPVGRWADQSGNNRHFNQAVNTSYRPSYVTNVVNSLPVIRYNVSTHVLDGPNMSALTAGEIFIVIKIDNDPPTGGNGGIWKMGTSGNSCHFPFSDSTVYDHFGSTTRQTVGNPTPSLASTFRLYNVISVSGEWTANLDGTQLFTTGTNTVGFASDTALGANEQSGSQSNILDGDIAEVIMYDNKISAGNRTSVKNYIATRYSLTIA